MTENRHLSKYWLGVLRSAECELDAAHRLFDLNTAAKRLMNAKRELTRLGVDWRSHLPEKGPRHHHAHQLRMGGASQRRGQALLFAYEAFFAADRKLT